MLSLVSLNIEGSRHLSRVLPFLRASAPDMVCLQELRAADVPAFEALIGAGIYVPMGRQSDGVSGVGIFSRIPLTSSAAHRYGGSEETLPEVDNTSRETGHATQ